MSYYEQRLQFSLALDGGFAVRPLGELLTRHNLKASISSQNLFDEPVDAGFSHSIFGVGFCETETLVWVEDDNLIQKQEFKFLGLEIRFERN